MEGNSMLSLDEFLNEHGFEETSLSNKEKLKVLKQILFMNGVDRDLEELRYTKNPESMTVEEYVNRINNLEVVQMNATRYILMVKCLQKEERKLKRKQSFQKIIGIFTKTQK